jgi:hypothetical protein
MRVAGFRLMRLPPGGAWIGSVLIRVYTCPFAVVFVVRFAVGGHAIR